MQTIPANALAAAWIRCKDKCECKRDICVHIGECRRVLIWNFKGNDIKHSWEAYIIDPQLPPTVDNIQILCRPCYDRVRGTSN
jgi:hypothetical protein